MGKYTSMVSFAIFLVCQFFQGIILDNFLRRETADLDQWLWLLADLLLLFFWLAMMYTRGALLVVQDMPFIPLPTMATAWGIYLLVVFIPRVAWLMTVAGTCLGETDPSTRNSMISNSTRVLEDQISLGLFSAIGWGANTLVTLLAVGSTTMFLFLVMSGYGQHGMLASHAPLDYDMAEAAFCMIDGVEFLGAFFEVGNLGQCDGASASACTLCNTTIERDQQVYLDAIEGSFGGLIIALTVVCFVLPFLALWQFKRRSAVIKANENIKNEARRLSSVTGELHAPGGGRSDDGHDVRAASLSVHHVDLLGHQHDMATVACLERELSALKIAYLLWDLVVINLTGTIVRFILWFKFNRPISALITKNILAVIFRSLNLINDYAVPWYQRRWGDEAETDEEIVGPQSKRPTGRRLMPRVMSFRKMLRRSGKVVISRTTVTSGPREACAGRGALPAIDEDAADQDAVTSGIVLANDNVFEDTETDLDHVVLGVTHNNTYEDMSGPRQQESADDGVYATLGDSDSDLNIYAAVNAKVKKAPPDTNMAREAADEVVADDDSETLPCTLDVRLSVCQELHVNEDGQETDVYENTGAYENSKSLADAIDEE